MYRTVCQLIDLALLQPGKALTVNELIVETGVSGRALLPVLNRMIGIGVVVVRGNKTARLTFVRDGGNEY
jgi:DNA-binding GntR family transcriptional regulator